MPAVSARPAPPSARSHFKAPGATQSSEPLVAVRGVAMSFGPVHALNDINLDIMNHEFLTLLGPSGCGKTTLLRLLGGFEHPTAGEIRLDGKDVAPLPPQQRPINTVFQNYALFPHMTVAGNIAFGLEMSGWRKPDIAGRVEQMLAMVRLPDYGNRRPDQLSGGQQQRVALARAMAPSPQLLLLDEPLSALDLKLRKEMQIELKRLQKESGISFVLVTHDQEEALTMSDRIAVMSAGRILQLGAPSEIYDRPVNRFVAGFIGDANIMAAAALGRTGGSVAVRPERVSVVAQAAGRQRGTVAGLHYLGSDTLLEVQTAEGMQRARVRGNAGFAIGDAVGLDWPDDAEVVLQD